MNSWQRQAIETCLRQQLGDSTISLVDEPYPLPHLDRSYVRFEGMVASGRLLIGKAINLYGIVVIGVAFLTGVKLQDPTDLAIAINCKLTEYASAISPNDTDDADNYVDPWCTITTTTPAPSGSIIGSETGYSMSIDDVDEESGPGDYPSEYA